MFAVLLQEGNTPQGSSHGVKISEPQKKTSFFRCSLLWGQRPSILAASWLDINGLCLLLALPPPFSSFSHPWPVLPVHTNHYTPSKWRTLPPFSLFLKLPVVHLFHLKETRYLQGSDHSTGGGRDQEHSSDVPYHTDNRLVLLMLVSLYYTLILHTAGSTTVKSSTRREKSLN